MQSSRRFQSIKNYYHMEYGTFLVNPYTQYHSDTDELVYHDTFEIGICLDGNGVFFIQNRIFPFSQGSIVVLLPGDSHFACSTNENPSHWIFMFFDCDECKITNTFKYSTVFYEKNSLRLIKVAADELLTRRDGYLSRAISIINVFFDRAAQVTNDIAVLLPNTETFEIVIPAINFIGKNYSREIRISELARECKISEDHFRRTFKCAVGISPQKYINDFRIVVSEQLLSASDKPVLEISLDVGFSSVSSFNRFFKEKNGVSPREYRNKQR